MLLDVLQEGPELRAHRRAILASFAHQVPKAPIFGKQCSVLLRDHAQFLLELAHPPALNLKIAQSSDGMFLGKERGPGGPLQSFPQRLHLELKRLARIHAVDRKPYKCHNAAAPRDASLPGNKVGESMILALPEIPYPPAPMRRYSEPIDKLLSRSGLLLELLPKEPLLWKLGEEFRALSDHELAGSLPIAHPARFAMVRGAVLYALDEIDAAHRIFQEEPSSEGSYWHGMMHRREGDFDNARYWFRRAGRLPAFNDLHDAARPVSPEMARQQSWDAYLFTGLCEQAKFGATEFIPECQRLQRVEFDVMFDRAWKSAMLK